jgi:hypothetical protein
MGKLTICGASCSILTDVAADMPNLRDTRIALETPVAHEARINRGARIELETPVQCKVPIARTGAVNHNSRDARKRLDLPTVWPLPKKWLRPMPRRPIMRIMQAMSVGISSPTIRVGPESQPTIEARRSCRASPPPQRLPSGRRQTGCGTAHACGRS